MLSFRRPIHLPAHLRPFSTTPLRALPSPLSRPGPPRLPAREQAEFEALQKAASLVGGPSPSGPVIDEKVILEHRDMRKKPKNDFEGEVNPKTGEAGGPKRDPFRFGRDWEYGGRVTVSVGGLIWQEGDRRIGSTPVQVGGSNDPSTTEW